jgi:hypothetical protein
MPTRSSALAAGLLASLPFLLSAASSPAQESQPWPGSGEPRYQRRDDAYRPPATDSQRYDGQRSEDPRYGAQDPPVSETNPPRYGNPRPTADDAYRPPRYGQGYDTPRGPNDPYSARPGDYSQGPPAPYGQPYARQPGQDYGQQPYPAPSQGYNQPYSGQPGQPYGRPYTPPGQAYNDPAERDYGPPGSRSDDAAPPGSYSSREILETGHGFFGSVSKGLASVVEYAFQKQGRPNGYILGQDAGGAFIAGLRYGEGILYTKDAGTHRVYWQGPSIGYDVGAEGSKVMMLVYNLRDPEEIYQRFGGVDGSAYLVGGAGVTFQQNDGVIVAPIRAGIGLRLGANVGYLKYTRRPTWNPF